MKKSKRSLIFIILIVCYFIYNSIFSYTFFSTSWTSITKGHITSGKEKFYYCLFNPFRIAELKSKIDTYISEEFEKDIQEYTERISKCDECSDFTNYFRKALKFNNGIEYSISSIKSSNNGYYILIESKEPLINPYGRPYDYTIVFILDINSNKIVDFI